jgi:hypothetical protein
MECTAAKKPAEALHWLADARHRVSAPQRAGAAQLTGRPGMSRLQVE